MQINITFPWIHNFLDPKIILKSNKIASILLINSWIKLKKTGKKSKRNYFLFSRWNTFKCWFIYLDIIFSWYQKCHLKLLQSPHLAELRCSMSLKDLDFIWPNLKPLSWQFFLITFNHLAKSTWWIQHTTSSHTKICLKKEVARLWGYFWLTTTLTTSQGTLLLTCQSWWAQNLREIQPLSTLRRKGMVRHSSWEPSRLRSFTHQDTLSRAPVS